MSSDDLLRDFAGAPPPAGLRERVLGAARPPRRWPVAAAAALVPLLLAANVVFEAWTTDALGVEKRPAVDAVVVGGSPEPLSRANAASWRQLRGTLGGDES